MSNLFVLPRQVPHTAVGGIHAGAKAHFFQTGTSTPKNTYSDAALTVAHPDPIVADAGGTFPAIFLDTSETEYRLTLRTATDALIYTQDNVGAKLTKSAIGAVLYPQTQAEAMASVIPTNYSIASHDACGRIFPKRYGAAADWDGNVGTDDTAALRNACKVMQQSGAPLDLAAGRYRIYSNTSDTARLGTFTAMSGVALLANGAELAVDRAFSTSLRLEVFRFVACTGIYLGDMFWTNGAGARSDIYEAGYHAFEFLQGCKNIKSGVLDFADGSIGVRFIKETTDPTSFQSQGIDLQIKATSTGYPLLATGSGTSMKARLLTESCGRSFFCNAGPSSNVFDLDLTVTSKNHISSADVLMQAEGGATLSNCKVRYTDHETTVSDNSLNSVQLEFHNAIPSIIRDIAIHLDIVRAGASYSGFGVLVRKFNSAIPKQVDTVDRGHVLENIAISGGIVANSAQQQTFSLMADATWGPGEFVRGINIHDLTLSGAARPNVFLASLKDTATFQNVRSDVGFDVTGNLTSMCSFVGCSAPTFTFNASDTSLATYIGCKITSATNQSIINKTFVGTLLAAQCITRAIAFNGDPTFGSTFNNAANTINLAQIKETASADGDTVLKIQRNRAGEKSMENVTQGAPDSGGAGFKVLRVPN